MGAPTRDGPVPRPLQSGCRDLLSRPGLTAVSDVMVRSPVPAGTRAASRVSEQGEGARLVGREARVAGNLGRPRPRAEGVQNGGVDVTFAADGRRVAEVGGHGP